MKWQPPTAGELHAQLPQYEILEILGVGGMGAVYKGLQTSLERYVAIKILPPSFIEEDLQYAQRFKQEAKTMARLSHPGIVGVHDGGETPQGLLYIVMEFVEGTDVHQMIHAQGHLPADQALAILMHVCDALSYAHQNGIIHRDIKPANIMVDTQGRVKVADFGLAKTVAVNTGLSTSNLTMGTPDYVAPEALVMGMEVDLRVDIYSLGVTLYEMLTGKVPRGRFEAASVRVPGLDPRFDQVVDRAMRDDREARYASAQALRDDLLKIHTVPLSQSGMRSAAARARAGPRGQVKRVPAAAPRPEESGPPVVLIGLAAVAVLALGLFLWKPWAAKESADSVASATEPARTVPADASSPPPVPKVTAAPAPAPPPQVSPKPVEIASPQVVMPKPASAPLSPAPLSEVDQRLATLDQQFQAAAGRDAGASFKVNVATLNKGYVGALDKAMSAATQSGKLEDALALREEKARMEKGEGVPGADLEKASDKTASKDLKDLRTTYRGAHAKIEGDFVKALQPLYDKYDQTLASYQADLSKAGQLDEAVHVRNMRERISKARLSPSLSSLAPTHELSGFTNSLGMNFVPVPGTSILMCIHETRRKDYAAFVAENPSVKEVWRRARTKEGLAVGEKENDPVVSVSWDEAALFCTWLGAKDGRTYRLPSDREWSMAAGIGSKEDAEASPESLNEKIGGEYPWGKEWPPPKGVGNFSIELGDDGFATTAPVMSFKPNQLGIYDLAGNVWEWCGDWWNAEHRDRIFRGGSWSDSIPGNLLSSRRGHYGPDARPNFIGFRCVAVPGSDAAASRAPSTGAGVPPESSVSPPSAIFTNTLGMKFVAVPGTKILMCIHETRNRDYGSYAAENSGVDKSWKNASERGVPVSEGEDNPVLMMNWSDARNFCEWLGKKEGRTYRLPTDAEWSMAVGIGEREARGEKVRDEYPWGKQWPPPHGAGNFGDQSMFRRFPPDKQVRLDDDDGYAGSAPVMQFAPNKLGIYDLAGNAWEWCEDADRNKPELHLLRGGNYGSCDPASLRSSSRISRGEIRYPYHGFRCVMVPP